MTNLVPEPNWSDVRQLEANEYATGGSGGNMNEQAQALANRTELLKRKQGANIPTLETPAAGVDPVTGVADGAYFNVRSTDDDTVAIEYQNIGGSAVATGKSYPSGSYVEVIAEYTPTPFETGRIYNVGDRVTLSDGSIARSTVNGNPLDPNLDYFGWFNETRYFDKYREADPRDFGCPNDGQGDDAVGIRLAIAYLDTIGGGRLKMSSKNDWIVSSLSDNGEDAFIIKSPILIDLGDFNSRILNKVSCRSVFKIGMDSTNYQAFWGFLGGIISGGNLAQHVVYSATDAYVPYIQLLRARFMGAIGAAVSINPYMGNATLCHFSFSGGGLLFNNSGDVREITSMSVSNCYANSVLEFGFKANNRMMYSDFKACGVDDCGNFAYDLDIQSGSIINCGAERSLGLFRSPNINDGVIINGLLGVGIGSLDPDAPADAAIEFSGSGVVMNSVSGVRILTHPTPRYRNKDLVVNVSSGKYPRVNILDNSILRENTQVNVVAGVTPLDDEPIKFNISSFRRTFVETVTPSNLKSRLDIYNKNYLQFTYTLQLSNGTEDLEKIIEKITGEGTYIIQGNTSDRTLVKLRGARLGLTIRNCSAKIIIRAVTFENNTGYPDPSLAQITVSNCREVIFDNVLFDATKHTVGTAIRAQNDSKVILRGGTEADLGHGATTVYQEQTGAKITIDPMPEPPTTGRWVVGQRIKNSNIGTGNIIEWVRVRNAANTADEWRPITV